MFHPFYVKNEDGTGEWKAASNLKAGDELLSEDGKKVKVSEVKVEKLAEEITVYNLELDEVHTYYVAGGVLVHNGCGKSNTNDSESGSNPKNVFPENPDDLLPEIPRNKATKANGTTSQTIQTSDNIRIRAEQHPLLPGETYNPRHHGVHYHVEYKVDPTKSWNNKNNVKKWYPEGYTPGAGSGFIPGEPFPE